MSQLLIVDIQNTYLKHIDKNIINKVPEYSKGFGTVFYLFDDINGQNYYDEVPESWMEEESFMDSLNVMTKNYAFFRGLMDLGLEGDDELLVKLGKFMLQHHVGDVRDISEESEIKEKFDQEFKNSPLSGVNFEDYSFYMPTDLIEELQSNIKSGVVLIGGGREECLKEISLLLTILEIDHTIFEELTY